MRHIPPVTKIIFSKSSALQLLKFLDPLQGQSHGYRAARSILHVLSVRLHSRGSRVHDAGVHGAAAGAAVVVVHAEVVTQLVSHDGGEGGNSVVGELGGEEHLQAFRS